MALALALCGLCMPAAHAYLTQEPISYDIPRGPLSKALIEIGRRTGAIVSFSPSLVEGKTAEPVLGRFTPMQAFMRALSASGLSIDVMSNGTVTVLAAPAAMPAAMPATKAPVEGPAPAAQETREPSEPTSLDPPQDKPVYALEPVLVLASAEASHAQGLRASNASTATRSDTPLSELPQSVSVVTRGALDLQSPNGTTTDALRYVTGVSANVNSDAGLGLAPALMVRGLPVLYSLSGMRTVRRALPIDSALVERIEVLKGPSGVIGGAAEFGGRGGVINLVRKSIETQAYTDVKQTVTSRDSGTLRTDLDAAGSLASQTYWRAIAYASRSGRTDSGHDAQHADGLLGVLGYRDADFKATLTLQTDRQRTAPAPASRGGMPRAGGMQEGSSGFTPVEPGQVAGVDSTDGLNWRSTDIELDLGWQLSSQWHMTWKGRKESLVSDARHHRYWILDDETAAGVNLQYNHAKAQGTGMQWGLIGNVATGPIKHRLLAALDFDRDRTQRGSGYASWSVDPASFEPGTTPLPEAPDYGDPNGPTLWQEHARKRAVLVQDQIRLGSWIARLAAQRSQASRYFNDTLLEQVEATNWDAGLLYQITPTASVYAGTQHSAEIDARTSNYPLYDGTDAPLRELRQIQAGTKLELLERRLALTLEAFRLRQLNTIQSSSELPGNGMFTLPGYSADGVEVELSGRASPKLDMNLGLNFIRAHDVVKATGSQGTQGVRIPATGVPERSISLLARYQIPGREQFRNSLGLAFHAYSSSWAIAPDPAISAAPLRLPGGAQLDLSWMHASERWSLRCSVENVFDRQLYGVQAPGQYIPLQPRRSAGLTLSFTN